VAACIPGIKGEIIKAEFIDQMRNAPAMFVAAMQQDDHAFRAGRGGGPDAIEQRCTVMGCKLGFCRFAMCRLVRRHFSVLAHPFPPQLPRALFDLIGSDRRSSSLF
jgi:hypothetical protein